MKLGLVCGLLYSLACIAAAVLSANIDGMGTGGVAIVISGTLVVAGVYVQGLLPAARIVALLSALLALVAAGLLLLAATIGGSFNLPGEQAALAALLIAIGVFGTLFFRFTRPTSRRSES